GWGGAMVFVPWELYRHTGQTELLREAWGPMLHWIAYLQSRSQDGLVVREEEGGWCLGDWSAPDKIIVEPELVNTALTIRMLEIMLHMADILEEDEARPALEQDRQHRLEALRRRFFHPETGGFGAQRQGAEAFALWCGAVREDERPRVLQKMLRDLAARDMHFDTGIFGTPILLELLSRAGEADTAFRLMTAGGEPSFRAMRERGATTLYENWYGGSHNHAMFGSADAWLYEWVAGLSQAEGSAGWKQIILRPGAVSLVNQAQATIETPLGPCALAWQREDGRLSVQARIPFLAQAQMELPDGRRLPVPPGQHEWRFSI
ncbi:MAG: alpha-L-rhamnosidase C-terminal domain-containing protein, partial [Aristaeellaceae bacterium]